MTSNEMKFNQEFGQLIRKARMQQGLSQKNMAAKMGITFQQFQKYEAGHNGISTWRLNQISTILGVSFSSYINREIPNFDCRILSIEEINNIISDLKRKLLS